MIETGSYCVWDAHSIKIFFCKVILGELQNIIDHLWRIESDIKDKVINACFTETLNKIFKERSIFHNLLTDTFICYVNLVAVIIGCQSKLGEEGEEEEEEKKV